MRSCHTIGMLAVGLTLLLVQRGESQTRPRPVVNLPAEPVAATPVDPDNPPAVDPGNLKTTVEFEILSESPSAGLDAHRWVEALQEHGVTVRVRTPKESDELGVKETVRGALRWVIATGVLDERGTLTFPDRKFTGRDGRLVKEWIDELKLYGALGAPEGKPLWGLTRDQFEKVFGSLSLPVANKVKGLPLDEALVQLQLPVDAPVRYHSTASAHLESLSAVGLVRPTVQGLTGGTALAIVLADYGLGYRPLRTPGGSIELVVEPLSQLRQPWPLGWEPEKGASRGQMAPGLFKFVPVGFNEVPLEKILEAVADVAAVPVVINYYETAAKGIDLMAPVSYPKKRAAYSMVLGSVIAGSRLRQEFRVDERGRPFIYLTAFVSRKVEDLSPAESD